MVPRLGYKGEREEGKEGKERRWARLQRRKGGHSPQVLREVANGTGDVFVLVEGEWYDGLLSLVLMVSLQSALCSLLLNFQPIDSTGWLHVIRTNERMDG